MKTTQEGKQSQAVSCSIKMPLLWRFKPHQRWFPCHIKPLFVLKLTLFVKQAEW